MDSLRGTLRERIERSGTKVEVTIHPSLRGRYWVLTVDRCPHCGRPHQHGGGTLDEPSSLGHRAAHCTNRHSAGYELVSSIKEESQSDR